MRLQSKCLPGLSSSEVLKTCQILILHDLLSRWFIHGAGKLVLVLVGGLSSFPHGPLQRAAWTSWQYGDWFLPEQIVQKTEIPKAFYDLATKITYCYLCHMLLVTWSNSNTCRRRLQKGINVRRKELLWAILETDHHTWGYAEERTMKSFL